jgi:hypothetical protein
VDQPRASARDVAGDLKKEVMISLEQEHRLLPVPPTHDVIDASGDELALGSRHASTLRLAEAPR